jgi:hypothetical protein
MPRANRQEKKAGPQFNRGDLHDYLRTEGQSFIVVQERGLNEFSKWINNATIPRFAHRALVTNRELIDALAELRIPGQAREIIKTLLSLRLFDSAWTNDEDATTEFFEAVPANQDDLDAALAIMAQDEADFGATASRALLEGVCNYSAGHLDAAFASFNEARIAYRNGEFAQHHTLGCLSVRPIDVLTEVSCRNSDLGRASGRLTLQSGAGFPVRKPIVLIGMDAAYHKRHAKRMLESGKEAVNFHFHICNPEAGAELQADNLRYSFEFNPEANRAYFATMRFLVLRELLQHYDCPIMSLDADCTLGGGVPLLFDVMEGLEVALNVNRDSRGCLPWRFTNAQVFAATPGAGAYRFLSNFENQFDHILSEDGDVSWWVDQCLLASTAIITSRAPDPGLVAMTNLSKFSGTVQDKIR